MSKVIMSREQVRAFDKWAIEELGVQGVVLMENAGSGCTDIIRMHLLEIGGDSVVIFCGTGNNGGDGFVIARHLKNCGVEAKVVICGDAEKIKGEAKVNLDVLRQIGGEICDVDVQDLQEGVIADYCGGADMIVDALFGTGLTGALRGNYPKIIDAINGSDKKVLAVDIPSGLDCDTGQASGAAIRASWTVTFAAKKKGFTSEDAKPFIGLVYVVSIGVEPWAMEVN